MTSKSTIAAIEEAGCYSGLMGDLTRILSAIGNGDSDAAGELLPVVYQELRQLAAQKLALENPGQTLQPTALVHEAYLRLIGGDEEPQWDSRGHFLQQQRRRCGGSWSIMRVANRQ